MLKYILLNGISAAMVSGLMLSYGVNPATSADFTLKFATVPQNEPTHEYMKRFEACLEPASDNRIDVQLYAGAQLGGMARMIEGLQLGTIEGMMAAGQHVQGVEKKYSVVDAPGLFPSIEAANSAYWSPEFREPYLLAGKDKGIMGIGIFAYGPVSFQSKDPISTLEDFRGKKIRIIATEGEQKLVSALGGTGVQVDFPEMVPALQRGQIDAAHASIVIANAAKFYTVAKNVTLTNESMIGVVAFLSTSFYDRLPADLQKAVTDCGMKAEREMQDVAIEFDAAVIENWKKSGGQVHRLNEEDQEKLFNEAVAIGKEVIGSDPDLKPLYDALASSSEN